MFIEAGALPLNDYPAVTIQLNGLIHFFTMSSQVMHTSDTFKSLVEKQICFKGTSQHLNRTY